MKSVDLENIKKVHCIGIGGIGVSALARLLYDRGIEVTGSDISEGRVTEGLKEEGIEVSIGMDARHIGEDVDLVVYSAAVPELDPDNVELAHAKELGIPALTYPEALGIVSQAYKTIAIAGTHGKTTTTAMAAKVLTDLGYDPTVIVGSLLAESGSNFRRGSGEYLVVEADEYKEAFFNLTPHILVITNIEADHLDYYRDLDHVEDAFRQVAEATSEDGAIVADFQDETVMSVIGGYAGKRIDFSKHLSKVTGLKVPGEHNRMNAAAALGIVEVLEGDSYRLDDALKSIRSFAGTWRRFEYKGKTKKGALVYDDYAHHPTEVRATLQAAREMFPEKEIVVAFQPHLFSRTKLLFDDFVSAFGDADKLLLLPIFPAREAFDPTIRTEMLVDAIKAKGSSVEYVESIERAAEKLRSVKDKGAIIFAVGAGDIYKLSEMITGPYGE